MNWEELKVKLADLRKQGWKWSTGYNHGLHFGMLWKEKGGIQKISFALAQGQHVIRTVGASPEEALTEALRRHGEANYDPPPREPAWRALMQGKPKESPSGPEEAICPPESDTKSSTTDQPSHQDSAPEGSS